MRYNIYINMSPPVLQISLTPQNQAVLVNLSWQGQAPQGIIEYLIFYYQQGSRQIKSMSTSQASVVIPQLSNDVTYLFRASAFIGSYQNGTKLAEASIQSCIPANVPDQVQNLLAVVSTSEHVIENEFDLSWDVPNSDSHYPILNYKVYISDDNVNYSLLASPLSNSHQIMNQINGVLKYIKVSAVSAIGESQASSVVSAEPKGLPNMPTDLQIN
jgi:hypothetical protein